MPASNSVPLLLKLFWLFLALLGGAGVLLSAAFLYLNPGLPDAESYREVKLKAPLRIYSTDGQLIQEYGERLMPITYDEVPDLYKRALLDTEDKRFYQHAGVDLIAIVRSFFKLVLNRGEITTGGSTITMQLARNLFLSRDVNFLRKFREILLALKIERELPKTEILALYLNVIPLGKHSFGVRAAAYTYYGKDVDELSLAQTAMLAGIAKRPEGGNPINGPAWALERRNLVLLRMLEQGSIDQEQYDEARVEPITASVHGRTIRLDAPYVAEMVRAEMHRLYGQSVYESGYHVYTTLDAKAQRAANEALIAELNAYDRRHGYRGPEARTLDGTRDYLGAPEDGYPENWLKTLQSAVVIGDQYPAIVVRVEDDAVEVLTADKQLRALSFSDMNWARPFITVNARGRRPESARKLVKVGDLIRMEPGKNGKGWRLGQVPALEGAVVALDPTDGAVRALVGGYDFHQRQFNHALQARRQPGSNLKPFFYAGALEQGLTAASIFNDAPMTLPGGELEESYRPSNSGDEFLGAIRLREALYRSINLVSLRVLLDMGSSQALEYISRFGFETRSFPRDAQLALGGGTVGVTPLEIARGYAAFANGGYLVQPYFIQRVENQKGETLLVSNPLTVCNPCDKETTSSASRIIEPRVAFIMDSILRDVIQRGTGRRALSQLPRTDLAGKTGTTNDADIWFSGYHPDLIVTVWAGYPDNSPIGAREFGNTVPLGTWVRVMAGVLPEENSVPPPQPAGIVRLKINPVTGLATTSGDDEGLFEYFRDEFAPRQAVTASRLADVPAVDPKRIF